MLQYSIAMAVRLVCVVLCFFVRGWWLVLPALGAVFLPYFAVVIANNIGSGARGRVQRPGTIEQWRAPADQRAQEGHPGAGPAEPGSPGPDRAEPDRAGPDRAEPDRPEDRP